MVNHAVVSSHSIHLPCFVDSDGAIRLEPVAQLVAQVATMEVVPDSMGHRAPSTLAGSLPINFK